MTHMVYKMDDVSDVIHYSDVIMSAMASQISAVLIVSSTVFSSKDQRKHQSSAWLAFVRGIHRWLVNSFHKGPVMQKMFPFDDVIMSWCILHILLEIGGIMCSFTGKLLPYIAKCVLIFWMTVETCTEYVCIWHWTNWFFHKKITSIPLYAS